MIVHLRGRIQVVTKVVHCPEKAKGRLEKHWVVVMGLGIVVNLAKQVTNSQYFSYLLDCCNIDFPPEAWSQNG